VPAGAHPLASDRQAAVYSLHGSVYSCDARTGRRMRLGSATVCVATSRVDKATLAGALAAYGVETCGVDTGGAEVVVRRLSDGKQLKRYPAATTGFSPESYQSVSSIVVRGDGAVAWISVVRSIIGRGTHVAVYRNGSVLDSTPGIAAGSLRLHGSTLSWTRGSTTPTATLR
jgi:hypothetical protein